MESCTRTSGRAGPTRGVAGFSLIELMFTIFIAAILIAIAVPSLRNMTASSNLTGQTNDLIAAISLARSQAITQNQQVTFCRTTSEADTACVTATGNWDFWLILTASGTVVRRGAKLASSVGVTSALTTDQLVFGSDGLARMNGVLVTGGPHLTICSDHSTTDNQRQVTLGAGSRVSTAIASGACP